MNGAVAIAIAAISASSALVVWVVVDAVVRVRLHRAAPPDPELAARLARMEAAIEAIAIEVERNGELQRFNARLLGAPAVEPSRVARPITPH